MISEKFNTHGKSVIGKDSKIGVMYIPRLQGIVHVVPKSFSL